MKLFSLLDKGQLHYTEGQKIIPRDQLEGLLDAKEIVAKAQEEAKRYTQENIENCAQERQKAYDEGYQEGLAQFNERIIGLETKIKEVQHEAQKLILPLALKAAKKILGTELTTHPDAIVDIVMQTLKPIREAHRIKILVSKEDRDRVEAKKAEIRDKLEQVQVLTIEERPELKEGDCIIETESGIINATLENQWRALEAAFETFFKKTS